MSLKLTKTPEVVGNMNTFERASNVARVVYACLIILAVVAIFFSGRFFGWLGDWLAEDPDQMLERFDKFIGWLVVFSLPLAIGGIFTYRNGRRAVASERFPPVGMWVVVDTPIERGARAKMRGRLLQLAALLMCAVALGFPFSLWYIVHSITGIDQ